MIKYILVCLALAVICAGCAHLFETKKVEVVDPKTGDLTYKEVRILTEDGEKVLENSKMIAKTATGPLGIPPDVIDWAFKMLMGWGAIESSRKGLKKLKDSKPGSMLG